MHATKDGDSGKFGRVLGRQPAYFPRRTLRLQSTIAEGGDDVVIHDMSHTGLLLETTAFLAERQSLDVELPELGLVRATVVWRSGRYFGCKFARPVSKAAVSAALLRSPITDALPLQPLDEVRAWEQLAELCAVPESEEALSFGIKGQVVLGTSILLWALILWAAGII